MKKNYIHILLYSIIALFIISCSSGDAKTESEESETELIEISFEQFNQENMEIGTVESKYFEDEIQVSGKVTSPANGTSHVSSKNSGIVERIYVKYGDFVNKGQVLLSVSSNELIVLQQNFAETAIALNKLRIDFERIQNLYNEDISSEKEYVAIESSYKSSQVKYNSLKLQLQRLGFDTEKVEKGEYYSYIPISSPISGYVTDINVVLGEYIDHQIQLFELIDVDKLQIELSVYEKDMKSIFIGDKIKYNSLGSRDQDAFATIMSVGKSVDFETNTITCIAKPDTIGNLISNSFIEAFVLSENREVLALPSDALVKSDGKYYVFEIENKSEDAYTLKATQVELGTIFNAYTEIINGDNLDSLIIQGAYNLPVE